MITATSRQNFHALGKWFCSLRSGLNVWIVVFMGFGVVPGDPTTPPNTLFLPFVQTATATNSATDSATDVAPAAPSPEVAASALPRPTIGIWISQQELAALPMTGPAWTQLRAAADSSVGSPTLADQDSDVNVKILAKALVYARTGEVRYRDEVVAALQIITFNNTENGGRTLALGRELVAYVIAADLIDLAGYQPDLDTSFRQKLRELLTKQLDTSEIQKNLVNTHEKRPNNWGTHAGAARATVAVYLGDQAELTRTAQVFQGYLGNRAAYSGFKFDSDLTWQADPSQPVAVNPVGASKEGHVIDGALPEEMRRGASFRWPPIYTDYAWEALQGATVQAEILQRAGYPAWEWQDRALLRAVDFLKSISWLPTGDDRWQPWLINQAYGQDILVTEAQVTSGKNMGWTNWTHNRPYTRDGNLPPVVNAGADQRVAGTNQALLAGSVSDDGLPNPPAVTTLHWSKVSGPGEVTFADATLANATATFGLDGAYMLRLVADDGQVRASDEVSILVSQAGIFTYPPVGDAYVAAGNATTNYGAQTTLRVRSGSSAYRSYLKFDVNGLSGPVQSAKLRLFVTDASSSGGELYAVANTYAGNSTPWQEQQLTWNNGPAVSGAPLATAGAAALNTWVEFDVQGVISGNGLFSFAIVGTVSDAVYYASKEGSNPAQLVVQLSNGAPGNQPPNVDAGADQSVMLPDGASLTGVASDDGQPNPPGMLTSNWQQVSGPGAVTFADPGALSTSVSFSDAGVYLLELSATDGVLASGDLVTITVNSGAEPGEPQEPDPTPRSTITTVSNVVAGSDDAEENSSGKVTLTSSDLELIRDSNNQVVGIRFRTVDVPPGATIINAYVQFQVDEAATEASSLMLQGEASNSALTFTTGAYNVSARPRTTAAVTWSPAPWPTVGVAGLDQRTPNLASVVQEVVNLPGWVRGNPLAIFVSGAGKRVAEAYEGGQAKAPRLTIDYTVPTVQPASRVALEEALDQAEAPLPGLEGITEPATDEDEPGTDLAQPNTIYLPLIQR